MRASWAFALAAGALAAAVWWLSAQPAAALAGVAPTHDKLVHAAVWAALAGATTLATWPRLGPWRSAALAIALAVGYGVVDELHQRGTAGRDASAWDLVADAIGSALGAAVAAGVVAPRVVYRRRDDDPA